MRFSIGTWNCFGMGQGWAAVTARRAPFSERFRHPGVLAQCAVPDVLCIQELLSRDAQRFFDTVCEGRYASRFRDDNRVRLAGRLTLRGCGLGIGTRLSLSKTQVRTFPGAQVGWDRLARKGVLYAQVSLTPDIVIDLVTVHLQAGYDANASAARAGQLADLRAFIAAVGSPERCFIVCGDFNIDGLAHRRDYAQYRGLTAALYGFQDVGAAADLATFEPHPDGNALAHAFEPGAASQRIDYIFFRPARGPTRLRLRKVRCFLDQPLAGPRIRKGVSGWASDHYGLSATFEYQSASTALH